MWKPEDKPSDWTVELYILCKRAPKKNGAVAKFTPAAARPHKLTAPARGGHMAGGRALNRMLCLLGVCVINRFVSCSLHLPHPKSVVPLALGSRFMLLKFFFNNGSFIKTRSNTLRWYIPTELIPGLCIKCTQPHTKKNLSWPPSRDRDICGYQSID